MGNTTDNRKLDEFVKNSLTNFEAPASSPDWQKMEVLLKSSSKNTSFNLGGTNSIQLNGAKKILSSYVFVIVLMLAGGAYLTYVILNSKKNNNITTESTTNIIDTLALEKTLPIPIPNEKKEKPITSDTHTEQKDTQIVDIKKTIENTIKDNFEKVDVSSTNAGGVVKKEEKVTKDKTEKKEIIKEKEKKEVKSEKELASEKKKEKSTTTEEKPKKETLKKSDNAIGLSNLLLQNIGAADTAKKTKNAPTIQEHPDTTSH